MTCVEPGPFHTDWAGRSLRQTENRIADDAGAPRHLVLGTWGFNAVVEQLQKRVQDIADQRDVSLSADFDDGACQVGPILRRDL